MLAGIQESILTERATYSEYAANTASGSTLLVVIVNAASGLRTHKGKAGGHDYNMAGKMKNSRHNDDDGVDPSW